MLCFRMLFASVMLFDKQKIYINLVVGHGLAELVDLLQEKLANLLNGLELELFKDVLDVEA